MVHNGAVPPSKTDEDTCRRVWQRLVGPGALLDEPTDILVAPHDIPVFLCSVRGRVPHLHPACPRPAPVYGAGCGLTRRAAQVSAVCEAIERYSASRCCTPEAVRATYRELALHGVDPQQFALYSETQYAAPLFHFQRPHETLALEWITGWSWSQQRPQYVPVCFVYLGPCAGADRCVFHAVSTGLACGPSEDQARLAGLCEVIERDALMIAWLNGLELPRVRPPTADPELGVLYQKIAAAQMQATVLNATTDVGLPVRIALVETQRGMAAACAVGMAAHPEPLRAHGKALLEACHTLNWLHQLQATSPGVMESMASVPLRTFTDHVRLYGDGRMASALDIWRCGPWQNEEHDAPDGDGALSHPFDSLVRRLARLGLEVLTVDITPADIAETGLRVCRTVVPGMQPLTPGRAACCGGARLQTVPRQLGYRARYGPGQWNPAPHPFP
jgi:ribosomal protein S12 methylthiotransferase accessory factor